MPTPPCTQAVAGVSSLPLPYPPVPPPGLVPPGGDLSIGLKFGCRSSFVWGLDRLSKLLLLASAVYEDNSVA